MITIVYDPSKFDTAWLQQRLNRTRQANLIRLVAKMRDEMARKRWLDTVMPEPKRSGRRAR